MKFGIQADKDVADGGGDWIRYIRKNGEYTFRFLEDWPAWTAYWEHFSQAKMMAYPCTGDREKCPGCLSNDEREAKASKRLLVNAVLMSGDGQGRANLWKFAGGLRNDLERLRSKSARNTLTDRPFTITRYEGSNNFVNYAIDREDPEPFDGSSYELHDHQAALIEAWEAANNPEKTAQVQAEREARKEDTKTEEAAKTNGHQEPSDDPLDEFRTEEQKESARQAKEQEPKSQSKHPRLTVVDDEPDETVTLKPSQIRKMTKEGLINLYRQAGFDKPETEDTEQLADHLIGQLRS